QGQIFGGNRVATQLEIFGSIRVENPSFEIYIRLGKNYLSDTRFQHQRLVQSPYNHMTPDIYNNLEMLVF
ncbi:MAG: hypothetical protein ACKPKO_18360, partial [Candidatus Fonsibacter sp.]